MKRLLSMLLAAPVALAAQAQSTQLATADVLGISLQTRAEDVLPLLKKKYPKLTSTATRREIMLGNADLMYDAMLDVVLESHPNGAVITQDTLHLNFLPDGSLLGLRRTIVFKNQKQTAVDILKTLQEKFGQPVFHYPGTSSEAGEMLWSNQLGAGLALVGMDYRQVGAVYTDNPGITPYPRCRAEMTMYTDEFFDPAKLYKGPVHQPVWKSCGTVADIQFYADSRLTFYVNRIELRLANVSGAPDTLKKLPQMLDQHPRTTRLVPASALPEPPRSAPSF